MSVSATRQFELESDKVKAEAGSSERAVLTLVNRLAAKACAYTDHCVATVSLLSTGKAL